MNNYDKNLLNEHMQDYADTHLERTNKDGWYICPWCGSGTGIHKTSAFHIFKTQEGDLRCKCSACGEGGDLFKLIMKVEGVSFKEALAIASDLYGNGSGNYSPSLKYQAKPKPKTAEPVLLDPEAPNEKWQNSMMQIVEEAERNMATASATDALLYLASRGIDEDTIRQYRIGFMPQVSNEPWMLSKGYTKRIPSPFEEGKNICIPCGITYPYIMDGKIYKLEMRRTPHQLQGILDATPADENGNKPKPDKLLPVKGMKTALFNGDDALCRDKRRDIFFTEGVIDALTINQVVGRWSNDEIKAVSFGAVTHIGDPDQFYRWYVMPYRIAVGFDNDKAGADNAHKLADAINSARSDAGRSKARIVFPPEQYNDWNEFYVKEPNSVFEYISNIFPEIEYSHDHIRDMG